MFENENSLEEVLVQMHPNPAHDVINLNVFSEQENTQANYIIEIYDMLGKKIYAQSHNTNNIAIDIKSYNNGVYLVHIINNEKIIHVDKLIISK